MKNLSALAVALGVTLGPPAAALSAEQATQSAEQPATPPKCLEAVVNPVTGFAFCVNPRGAPVDPPPVSTLQPCKPRPQDKETWSVYEHWSGCGD